MSERQQSPYDSISRSWLALVERRQQNFIELCNTGRWRHYYTRAQLLDEMRKVLRLRNQWAQLAGLPVSEQTGFQQIELQQNIKQSDRREQDLTAPRVRPLSRSAVRQRQPASAILAAVAGRLLQAGLRGAKLLSKCPVQKHDVHKSAIARLNVHVLKPISSKPFSQSLKPDPSNQCHDQCRVRCFRQSSLLT